MDGVPFAAGRPQPSCCGPVTERPHGAAGPSPRAGGSVSGPSCSLRSMGDIAALRGTWNIVPTPFLPSGELDLASIPGLVAFVRGTGVDGMTILGVLGEAGRLGDAERSAVIAAVLASAASSVPVCVGVSHASTDRAVTLAREAETAGARSV